MIKTILKNIAYTYYPKEISNTDERDKYLKSIEFSRLFAITNNFHKNKNINANYIELMSEFKKYDFTNEIQDVSLLHWQDRALTFEVEYVEDTKLIKLCVNISLLIPYYIVYILENEIQMNPYKWITLPKRNKKLEITKYSEHITLISSIVEKITRFNLFPDDLTNVILPDLSFKDIRMGDFTFFNAFFLDENKF